MRACYTSDLHGDPALYAQLGELIARQKCDLVLLGGDLFADVDRHQPIWPQVVAAVATFLESLDAWRRAHPDIAIACIGGNHEIAAFRTALLPYHRAGRLTLLDHRKCWRFAGVAFLGYSSTPPSPHWAKDYERFDRSGDPVPDFPGVVWHAPTQSLRPIELGEHFRGHPSIEQDLAAAAAVRAPWIFLSHAPPYESKLDRMPELSYPVGSRAVRAFIAARQPGLALHGHFHHSHEVTGAYRDRIGRTLCVNPGQSGTTLHAVHFELDRPAETLRHTVLR